MMRVYELMPGRMYLSARTHTLTDNEVRYLIGDHDITGVMNLWHTPDARVRELVGWYEQKTMPDGKVTGEAAIVAEYAAVRVERHIREGGCSGALLGRTQPLGVGGGIGPDAAAGPDRSRGNRGREAGSEGRARQRIL